MRKFGLSLLLSGMFMFLLVTTTFGCAVKKPAVTILGLDDYFIGEWTIKSVDVFQDNMSVTGKAEAMPGHMFKAYWIQSLPPFYDERTDFSGRWTLDEKTNSLKLEFVVTDGAGYKSSDTGTLKYEFVNSSGAEFRSLILSVSPMDMFVEQASLEGTTEEEFKKEIDSLPQDQREDLEKPFVKIVLERKSSGK